MKRFLLLALLALPILAQARDNIAVFPFSNAQGYGDFGTTKMCETAMLDFLVNQNRLDVMERAKLDQVITEQKLEASGLIDEKQAVNLGKIAGVKYGVLGEVSGVSYNKSMGQDTNGKPLAIIKASITVTIRIIDIESGKVIMSGSFKRPGGGLFDNLIMPPDTPAACFTGWVHDIFKDDVHKKLDELFPLTGYVVTMNDDGKTLVVDLGKGTGVAHDQKYDVIMEEKKTVAATKKVVTIVKKVGRIRIKDVSDDTSTAEIEDGKANIKEGMKLVSQHQD